ncbi:MAG: sulfotransferase family 2 domain-containing protein [Nanoarchaeota archaeon]
MDQELLYIFLHVPKTGGLTVRNHIVNNFRKDKILELYSYQGRKQVINRIKHLKNKDDIQVIIGHGAYYGIHKLFNKKYRYILFLRHPVDRMISNYNFQITRLSDKTIDPRDLERARKSMVKSNKTISLEKYLKITNKNDLCRFLMKSFFDKDIKNMNESNLRKLKNNLNKFYFIGITENPEDYLFVYSLLNIKKFYFKSNKSERYFIPKDYSTLKKKLIKKGNFDFEIYKYALYLNKRFKMNNNFYSLIAQTKTKRKMILPFTGTSELLLRKIYKLSSISKQKINKSKNSSNQQ